MLRRRLARKSRLFPSLVCGLGLVAVIGTWVIAESGGDSPPQASGNRRSGSVVIAQADTSLPPADTVLPPADSALLEPGAEGSPTKTPVPDSQSPAKNPNPPSFATWLDAWFGKYIVSPLETVLFYDFGSGPRYNDAPGAEFLQAVQAAGGPIPYEFPRGVASSGWLRLGKDDLGTSVPFVVLWLGLGAVFFTLRMAFINFRGFWHAIRLTRGDYDDPNNVGEVSHFQALASALSATVGLGNIAGVAIAVGTGGPGAVFWIIIAGLFGMTAKFAECTLGLMYRRVLPDGTVSGGPMHYLKDGLRELGLGRLGLVLAPMFAIFCVLASLGGGNTFQVVQSLGAVQENFNRYGSDLLQPDRFAWVYGLIMAIMVGVVIIGGIRSIGNVAGKIVPLMCGLYMFMGLWVLLTNFSHIDDAFAAILDGAFTGEGVRGGVVGVLIIGIKRAAFSNEAGVGSASIAHSAAKTDEPVSEGIVALLEPFIDTVVVCTMTGLMMVITGAYKADVPAASLDLMNANERLEAAQNAGEPAETISALKKQSEQAQAVLAGEQDKAKWIATDNGAALTMKAVSTAHEAFTWVLCIAVVMFAYSTLISWSYYGERCSVLLFGPKASIVFKIVFVICAFLGSLLSQSNILAFSDLMILSMAFPNILGAVLLSNKVKRALDDYWGRYKRGEMPANKGK